MLNLLWAAMIIIGIVYAVFTGNMSEISDGVLDSAKSAIDLCITMAGVISLWTGLMAIAVRSGLICLCTDLLSPLMCRLFPKLQRDGAALDYITTNVVANVFGLGWAATPAGLKAMEELSKLNGSCSVASTEMCTFLVLNISSLQLLPVNMIAYRSMYGSENPTAIVAPAILATLISTFVGIIFCRIMSELDYRKEGLKNG